MEGGAYWAQENLKVISCVSALHAILVSIVKRHIHSRFNEELIAMMEENRGEIRRVQKKDVDEANQLQSGEDIMQLFLINKSRVESITLFLQRIYHNSTHTNVAALENKTKNRRTTRSIDKKSAALHVATSHKNVQQEDKERIERKQ